MKIMGLHGLCARSSLWGEFCQYFPGDDFFVPDIDYSNYDFGKIRRQFLSFQPDVLIGHSFGGYIAQKLLERNPEGVKFCVLLASVGPRGLSVPSCLRMFMVCPGEFVKGFLKGKFEVQNCVAKRIFLSGLSDEMVEKYYPCFVAESPKAILLTAPFRGNIKKPIPVPTLVISGGYDVIVSEKESMAVANFHQAKYLYFANLGHFLLTESIAYRIQFWIKTATG